MPGARALVSDASGRRTPGCGGRVDEGAHRTGHRKPIQSRARGGQSWKKKIPAKINLPGAGETTNENQAQLRSEGLAMQKNWELQRTPD